MEIFERFMPSRVVVERVAGAGAERALSARAASLTRARGFLVQRSWAAAEKSRFREAQLQDTI